MSIGGFISGLFGSTNKSTATAPTVDPNAYQYGGAAGGADEAANRYAQTGQQAQARQGAQAQYTGADYGYLNQDRGNNLMARVGQDQAAHATLARALGQTPSIAQMQADRQMQQAAASQASAAASARGPAALALAQQNAANNTANAQSDISGQAQINAANERLQAEQAAGGMFGNMRGLDAQSQGMDQQQSQFDAASRNQMSQYNATNQMQQRELNDRMQLGMTSNEMGVRGMQLGAQQNQQAQQSANQLGAAGINAGVGGQNAAMNQQNATGLIGMGTQVAGGYAAGGGGGSVTGKATGGPVGDQQPYLVGENGPELVVPKQDATVVPSSVTVPLLQKYLPHRESGGPMAPSTWGTGQMSAEDQALAADQLQKNAEKAAAFYEQDKNYQDPYQKVLAEDRAARAVGIVPSEGDGSDTRPSSAQEVRTARYMVGEQRRRAGQARESGETLDEKENVAAGKAIPQTPRSRLASILGTVGSGAQKMSNSIDTAYHGPTQFHGPALIPVSLPARAFGGPMMAGGAPNPMAGGPAFEQLGGGGMNVLGSLRAQSNFATQYQRNPTIAGALGYGGPMCAKARADGGPMKAEVIDLDEDQPNVIDLDARDEGDVDRPKFDQRQVFEPPQFHRDTKAEQRAVKRGYEDKASRDADEMMAGYKASLAQAPIARVTTPENQRIHYVAAREDGGPMMSEATAERLRSRSGAVNGGETYGAGTDNETAPTRNDRVRPLTPAQQADAASLRNVATSRPEPTAAIVHASPVEPRPAPVLAEQGPDEQALAMQRAAQTTSRVPMLMPLGTFLGGYFGSSRGR